MYYRSLSIALADFLFIPTSAIANVMTQAIISLIVKNYIILHYYRS